MVPIERKRVTKLPLQLSYALVGNPLTHHRQWPSVNAEVIDSTVEVAGVARATDTDIHLPRVPARRPARSAKQRRVSVLSAHTSGMQKQV